MNVLLTDWLRCPRCGPDFGLILLAARVEDRRVYEGWLGCANCRERYRVSGGVADLRWPGGAVEPAADLGSGASSGGGEELPAVDPREGAIRLAAFLGLAEGQGRVALGPDLADSAEALAAVPHEYEVVQMVRGPERAKPRSRVSPVVSGGESLPMADRALAGMALVGPVASAAAQEAARLLVHGGRLVVMAPASGDTETVRSAGLEIMVEDSEALVACRSPWPGRKGGGVPLPTV